MSIRKPGKFHSPFSEWINKKYDEWVVEQIRQDRRANTSIAAFGREFGAKHQVLLNWMRAGSSPPRKPEYVERLIERYGKEAYQALGLQAPGVRLGEKERRLLDLFDQTPEDRQDELLEQIEKFLLDNGFIRED
jgi:hypothetical protein